MKGPTIERFGGYVFLPSQKAY